MTHYTSYAKDVLNKVRAVPYGDAELTVRGRLDQIRSEIKVLANTEKSAKQILSNANQTLIHQYFERVDALGTNRANMWLIARPN